MEINSRMSSGPTLIALKTWSVGAGVEAGDCKLLRCWISIDFYSSYIYEKAEDWWHIREKMILLVWKMQTSASFL